MPGLFSYNVANLSLSDIELTRPSPIPEGWNPDVVVIN